MVKTKLFQVIMTYDKKTPMFKIYTTGQPTKNLEFLNLCSRSQPFILMLLFKLQGAACHSPSRGQPPAVVPSDLVSEGSRAKSGLVSEAADPPHLVLFLPVCLFLPLDNQIPIYFSQKIWEGQKKTKEQNTATRICLPRRPPPSSRAC